MHSWVIKRYSEAEDLKTWNSFVEASRNSSFLFQRGYMDYHADRFTDCSLMAFRNGKPAAMLPANICDTTLYSHQGLTYGGWILPPSGLDCADILELWRAWLIWCGDHKISRIIYKPIPTIYQKMPSEEDIYLLFRCEASLLKTDISSAINLTCNPGLNKLQRRHLAHIEGPLEIVIASGGAFEHSAAFHSMLTDCLQMRHNARPVHSLEELDKLMLRFPDNISLWMVMQQGKPQAGVCLYSNATCNHCQYIATTLRGRELNLLTPLFSNMIAHTDKEGKQFFDFGTSNGDEGRYLNAGLNRQKTSFGASGVAYQTWLIDVNGALRKLQL